MDSVPSGEQADDFGYLHVEVIHKDSVDEPLHADDHIRNAEHERQTLRAFRANHLTLKRHTFRLSATGCLAASSTYHVEQRGPDGQNVEKHADYAENVLLVFLRAVPVNEVVRRNGHKNFERQQLMETALKERRSLPHKTADTSPP